MCDGSGGVASPAPGVLAPVSVLVVDDDVTNRRLLSAILQGHGYRLREAADGIEALALCGAEMPDVVVLDMSMPRLDGLGVLAAMDWAGWQRPSVVVVSGTPPDTYLLSSRVTAVLGKPFTELALAAAVRDASMRAAEPPTPLESGTS